MPLPTVARLRWTLLTLLTPFCALAAQQGSIPAVDPLVVHLDRAFRAVDSLTTPGCVVGVARRGMPTVTRSYGVSDLEAPQRITPGSIFEAGSVSKQFTAAAILLLAYDGKLSLDDDVRRWLPEFSASGPRFTIRQLLHHQAGLRDWGDIVELSGWPRGTRSYQMADIVALLARQRAHNFSPGTEYSYSNSNFVIAATIVARASGESFATFTARRIFTPLGMIHTSWRDDFTRLVPQRALAWTPDDNGLWHLDMPFENVIGHAGLLTTVDDLLRWQANFGLGIVGGSAFTLDMERVGILRDGRATGYALGLEVGVERGVQVVSHGGATAGYRAYLGRVPTSGTAVALLCNNGAIRSDQLGPTLLALANGDTTAAADDAEPALGPTTTEGARSRLTGQFRNVRTGQPVQLRAYRDGVTLNSWVGFRARGPNEYLSDDGARTLRFELAPDGAPRGFHIAYATGDAIAYRRADAWTPPTGERGDFAGRFRSVDADAVWELRVVGDSLRVFRRSGQSDAMVPVYRDAFQVPSQGWLVTFRRDASNHVAGLEVRTTRMRAMPFLRIE